MGLHCLGQRGMFRAWRKAMNIPRRRFSQHSSAIASLVLLVFVGLACNLQSDDDWKKALANKKLSRASTSGSISDKTVFYFCPNGDYAMQSQFSGLSTGGAGTLSMANEDVELGKWSIRSGSLVVQPQNSEMRQYDLSMGSDSNVIELNGNGYLVDPQNECP